MKIQHNLTSLNTYGRLVSSAAKAEKALEQLSSGYRLNRSADDAAGLAVSEKLRAQIRGLKQAIRNCQDGENLVQTFEGALNETQVIVQRCKQLAAESANGSYDNDIDRAAVEQEYKQLCKEVNNISDTDFNGLVMLNGGKLASVEKSGLGWINPIELDWEENTFENNTDDDQFTMNISKLPALDNYTLVDAEEYAALSEFDQSEISVELVDGVAEFKFSNEPPPEKLSIISKNNIGTVVMETSAGIVEIAKVTIPTASIDIESKAVGTWSNTNGSFSATRPKVTFEGSEYDLNNVTTSNDLTGDAQKTARELYDRWNLTYNKIASNIRCVVSDNLEEFTIKGSMTSMIVDHTDDKIYKNGDTITLKTEPAYTDVKVTWSKSSIYPGAEINGYSNYSSPSTTHYYYGTRELHDNEWRQPYVYLSIGTLSSGTPANYDYTKPSAEGTDRGYFLEHGNSSFVFTYTPPANGTGEGRWDLKITRYDDNGVSGTFDTSKMSNSQSNAAVKSYETLLNGISLDSAQSRINAAHKQGYFTPNNSYYVDGNVPLQNSYTFSFSIGFYNSTSPGRAWDGSTSSDYNSNSFYSLKEYDPEDPSKGGIDYSKVTVGESYTYKNDNFTETAGEGYWVDSKGTKYTTDELKSVGVYIPSKELRYAQYPKQYLHTGLKISITGTDPKVNGTAKASVRLWDTPSDYKTEDDSLGDLTYAQSLVIQSNSRSKDAVNFTFKYSTTGQSDLICDLNCSAAGLGMDVLSLATQESANQALDRLDESLNKVSMVRACFGAVQNRLAAKAQNITVTRENLTTSESQIRDADMPNTMVEYTRSQLVEQAANAMLAQANIAPRSIMQLLDI